MADAKEIEETALIDRNIENCNFKLNTFEN